jgi:hypothetical protein
MRHDTNDARLAEGKRLRAIRPTRQGDLLAIPDTSDPRWRPTPPTPPRRHGHHRLYARRSVRLSRGLDCKGLSKKVAIHFRVSVWHSGGLTRLAPKFLLCSEKSTELQGRSTDGRRERLGLKCRTGLRVYQDLVHRTVEFLNDSGRSSRWRHDSKLRSVFESSKINAAFPERRNV